MISGDLWRGADVRWVGPATVREGVLLEPGDLSGYMVGFQKAWTHDAARRTLLRAEILNTETAHRGRNVFANVAFVPLYIHNDVRQGHTQRGQVLGSYAGPGGGGAIAAVDTYHAGGRWTLFWSRALRRHRGSFAVDGVSDPKGIDVLHTIGGHALFFRGRYDLIAGATAVYELNRDFQSDAFNLNLMAGVRVSVP